MKLENPSPNTLACRKYYERNKQKRKEHCDNWRRNNPEKHSEQRKKWRGKNKDLIAAQKKRDYEKHKEKRVETNKEWQKRNREKLNKLSGENHKRYRKENPCYKIMTASRCRINAVLRYKTTKSAKTIELMGCSSEKLKEHLEGLFQPGMNWDNHGHTGWHIDHIIPCASFDLTKPEEQKKCFHYTNLQPLWWHQNLKKGAKNG